MERAPDNDKLCGLLRVGDLARLSGKTVRALHLYEEMELLRPIERSQGGYRLYGDDAVARVGWIGKLQTIGFSLPEIREFLRNAEHGEHEPGAMRKVRTIFAEKLAETRTRILEMRALEGELLASLNYLERCGTCAELSTPCVECDGMVHDIGMAPKLVTGLSNAAPAAHKA